MPFFASIEPASYCQLRCPECPVSSSSRSRQLLDWSLYRRILEQLRWTPVIQFYFQGEPLLHHRLAQMISLAHHHHHYTIVSTNAQLLTPELADRLLSSGLNRIIVSIDGLSEQSYAAYRVGGSLQRALDGLRALQQAKQKMRARCVIELQCLKLKTNEHEWPLFKRNYRQLGADILTFKTAQFYDYRHGNPLMPTRAEDSRYIPGEDGLYRPKNRVTWWGKHRPCLRILTGCVIDVNGNVRLCCFDKKGDFILGNIKEQSLWTIMHGNRAKEIHHKVWFHRDGITMCQNCTG